MLVSCLEGFYLFCKGGYFRGHLKQGDLDRIFISFSRCNLSESRSPHNSWCQGRDSLVIAAGGGGVLVLQRWWAWS